MEIQSVQNQRVKQWMKLHTKKGRDEMQRFLVEGEHLIFEALKKDCVETLLVQEKVSLPFSVEDTVVCHQNVMKKLCQSNSGCTSIAICKFPVNFIQKEERLVLLDNIQDPGNMGTIIRTATSFGFDGIICSKDCVDIYNDKVIRSTQGALFSIPIVKEDLGDAISELKKKQVKVVATALKNAISLSACERQDKMAFIFGNEGQGIQDQFLEQADEVIKIEMNAFESLNVAVAAGICMHTFMK